MILPVQVSGIALGWEPGNMPGKQTTQMQRFPGPDLLRAIAILWVLLFHGLVAGIYSPVTLVARWGWMGVDLFFVLSGYLIGSQLLKSCVQGAKPAIGRFYLRRAFRILPAYLVVGAFYFALPFFRETRDIEPLWQFLTFTENLLIDYAHDKAFSHVWSLCVEEHFYLVFPLLVWWLGRLCPTPRAECRDRFHGGPILQHFAVFPENLLSFLHATGRVAGGRGLAAIKWLRPSLWRKAMNLGNVLLAPGLAGVAGAIWVFQDRFAFWPTVLGYPLLALGLALIVTASVSPHCVIGRIRVPGAKVVATVAFSLYLSHKMTWHVVQSYLPGLVAGNGPGSFLVFGLAAFGVGLLLYWLVERPFLLLRDRIDDRFAIAPVESQPEIAGVPVLTGMTEETGGN